MNGKEVKAVLKVITKENLTNGTLGELWEKLPEYVAGPKWAEEVEDLAARLCDWFIDEEDVTEDYLTDSAVWQLANSQIEDYYSNINKTVQELSLWAYPALDSSVIEYGFKEALTLTDLNSNYLFVATKEVLDSIASFTIQKLEELAAA